MSEIVEFKLTVNGKQITGRCEPRKLLVDFLREDLGLTGTHIGCEHGICGACTILINGEAARSCIMFAVQADGLSLTTIEGLAAEGEMHPLQQAFHEHHGLQCGYCTPGMSAVLCRCTGYQQIVDAVLAGAAKLRERSP
jgi:aerobic-type carbon monoxide dehydrogenase small subunit (CoxS/CutS family)